MTTNSDMLLEEVNRLFVAFPSGANPDQAAMYVRVLRAEAIAADRLRRVVDSLERTWERRTPPSVAQLLRSCRGSTGAADRDANEARARDQALMRDQLERLCDYDVYAFQDAYGVWPDRRLYDRMNVTPPASMTFRVYPRPECDARRQEAIDACRAAFDRMRKAKRAPLVAPSVEPPKAEAPRGQLALEAQADEPENLLAGDELDEPPIGDEPVFDAEEIAA